MTISGFRPALRGRQSHSSYASAEVTVPGSNGGLATVHSRAHETEGGSDDGDRDHVPSVRPPCLNTEDQTSPGLAVRIKQHMDSCRVCEIISSYRHITIGKVHRHIDISSSSA